MIEVTRPLAGHIVHSRYEGLPTDVRHKDAPTAAQLNTMSISSCRTTTPIATVATVAHPDGAPTAGLLALAETRCQRQRGAACAVSYRAEHRMSSRERPMTDAELNEKFRGQTGMVLPSDKVEALMQQC